MAFVTSIERMGREDERAAGLIAGRETLRRIMEGRFGAVPASLEERITKIDTLDDLNALLVKAAVAPSLEEIEQS